MFIYAFGSLCRGEIDEYSDVDLLAVINGSDNSPLDTHKFSVYQEKRMFQLWEEGNPFAWHLHTESKLIFSNNTEDLFEKWGEPNTYDNMEADLKKFSDLFYESCKSLKGIKQSDIFDLSMLFLSIRNFASCYSLGFLNDFNFSRNSALKLKSDKLIISDECYSILERARILSTRGSGDLINDNEINTVLKEIDNISNWFQSILKKI